MNEDESIKKADILTKKKVALTRNRNLCVTVAILLGFNAWTTIQNGDAPLWFYVAMSLIMLAIIAIAIYGFKAIKNIEAELQALHAESENTETKQISN
ncbi:MAG: hypothetical protein R3Y36_03090 [Spirochaetales bacterium]